MCACVRVANERERERESLKRICASIKGNVRVGERGNKKAGYNSLQLTPAAGKAGRGGEGGVCECRGVVVRIPTVN